MNLIYRLRVILLCTAFIGCSTENPDHATANVRSFDPLQAKCELTLTHISYTPAHAIKHCTEAKRRALDLQEYPFCVQAKWNSRDRNHEAIANTCLWELYFPKFAPPPYGDLIELCGHQLVDISYTYGDSRILCREARERRVNPTHLASCISEKWDAGDRNHANIAQSCLYYSLPSLPLPTHHLPPRHPVVDNPPPVDPLPVFSGNCSVNPEAAGLRLRNKPSLGLDSTVITHLAAGAALRSLGEASGEFIKVETAFGTGWVAKKYTNCQ